MTAKYALATMVIGTEFEPIWSVARPTFELYAERFGLDLIVLREQNAAGLPHYAKRALHGLLDRYERLMYVDADVLIRDDAPNLFGIVPEARVGLLEEGRFFFSRRKAMERFLHQFGRDDVEWVKAGKYYNTGVMVLSRCHASAFAQLSPEINNFGEQTHLNYLFWKHGYSIFELDHRFNRMGIVGAFTGEPRQDSFFLHYAGTSRKDLVEKMQSDLQEWDSRPLRYRRKIFLRLGNTARQQVACEPLVRYCLNHFYGDDDFVVVTAYPELLSHYAGRIEVGHPDKVVQLGGAILDAGADHYFVTKDGTGPRHLSLSQVHPLDSGALATIQRQLVGEERRLILPEVEGISGLQDTILIHRGVDDIPLSTSFLNEVSSEIRAENLTASITSGGTTLEILRLCRSVRAVITGDPIVAQIAGAASIRVGTLLTPRVAMLTMPWRSNYDDLMEDDMNVVPEPNRISVPVEIDHKSVLVPPRLPSRDRIRQFLITCRDRTNSNSMLV